MSTIERSGFFSSIDGDRLYTDDEFADYFGRFLQDGVFPLPSDGLYVEASGTNTLKVNPGSAWIQGRVYELLEEKTLTIEPGDALLARIDRVVIRCNYIERNISLTIKKGVQASEPVAPELQRDTDIYELCIAEYRIEKGATTLTQSSIRDTRKDIDMCGEVTSIIDKHTLKDFCKIEGFKMQGDITTKNLMPTDLNCILGAKDMPYRKLYVDELDVRVPLSYLPLTGGAVRGDVHARNFLPYISSGSALGSANSRFKEAHIINLKVYGEHPFINKEGGNVTGHLDHTYAPDINQYQEKYEGFDNNGQGDGNTYIGYNLDGLMSHIFRGKGNFSVSNPVATFKDLKAEGLIINGKRLYIQSTAPTNAPEGSVWIKV